MAKKTTIPSSPSEKATPQKSVDKTLSPTKGPVTLLIGTRKGGFLLTSDSNRGSWELSAPLFLGHIIHHLVRDGRDGRTTLMAAKTGHLGPTIFRSIDRGKSWKEASGPPAFPKETSNDSGEIVDHTFWLTPGHPNEPGVWYAGTSPPGLFRSEDGGETWNTVKGFNAHPQREKWIPPKGEGPPGGATLHSILIDPRDAHHLYIGISMGGVFESRDRGESWTPLNQGCEADFLPESDPEYGHDPHCIQLHAMQPDRLFQQNHCGIYRMDRTSHSSQDRWIRIGRTMPKTIGDIGFPILLHPRDPQRVWVFPMDGTSVWPRVSPGGKPAVYMTRNGGQTWNRQSHGLPPRQAWWTVKRQAMAADSHKPVGLYLGTTSGEVWASRNEGTSWQCLVRHLPEVYSIEVALGRP